MTANVKPGVMDQARIHTHLYSTFDLHNFLFTWLLPPCLIFLLVATIFAHNQSIPHNQADQYAEPARQERRTHCNHDLEQWPPSAYITLYTVIPLASLVLLDPKLSVEARLSVLLGGPALIIGTSYCRGSPRGSRPWWLVFLLSGSLLVFGMLWCVLYTSFSLRWDQAQALISWTCSSFVWLSQSSTGLDRLREWAVNLCVSVGQPVKLGRKQLAADRLRYPPRLDAFGRALQVRRHEAGTNQHRALQVPPSIHRPELQQNRHRMSHRQAGRNMFGDFKDLLRK